MDNLLGVIVSGILVPFIILLYSTVFKIYNIVGKLKTKTDLLWEMRFEDTVDILKKKRYLVGASYPIRTAQWIEEKSAAFSDHDKNVLNQFIGSKYKDSDLVCVIRDGFQDEYLRKRAQDFGISFSEYLVMCLVWIREEEKNRK